jgi:hypothetical protein
VAKIQNARCEEAFLDDLSTLVDDAGAYVVCPEEVVVHVAPDVFAIFVQVCYAEIYLRPIQRIGIPRAEKTFATIYRGSSREIAM